MKKTSSTLLYGALAFGLLTIASCSAQKSSPDTNSQLRETSSTNASTGDKKYVQQGELGHQGANGKNGLGPQGPQVLIGIQAGKAKFSPSTRTLDERKSLLVAIDTPYQIFKKMGSYIHVAAWRTDGTPAEKADVFVGETHMGKTDKHGTLVFQYPPRGNNAKSLVGGHVLTVVDAKERDTQGSVPFRPMLRTSSFASDHVFVYTDRGVYKPGDTIKLRSIGWHLKEDYQPLVEKDLEFLLRDSKNKLIGGAKRTTDEFGIASTDISLPPTAREGLYTLEVIYGRARQKARLQVREFKAPKYQIQHDLARFLTKDQAKLATKIMLEPSTGGNFDKGTLKLEARANGALVFSLEKKVAGNGPHVLEATDDQFKKLKAALNPNQWAHLTVSITDGQGIRDTLKREMRYVVSPYVAVIELDKDNYSTNDPVELIAKIRDLDGVPVKNKVVELKYKKQSMKVKTNDKGVAIFSFKMPAQTIQAALYIEGVKPPITSKSVHWINPRPMVSHIPNPVISEMEFAHVRVKFPTKIVPVEKVVHMDVIDTSGALVNAILLPIKKTDKGYIAEGKFSAPSWGSMLLTFFALGREKGVTIDSQKPHHSLGLLTEGQNLVVQPNRTLDILLDGIPDNVAPGQKLNFKVTTKNKQGQHVQASVGAAIVDRRVLSLKDPLEITPMDHFYEPTLRTMSTTGSKILSWPVVSRNWGTRTHDVALPPFPFLSGGTVRHQSARHGAVGHDKPEEEPAKDVDGNADPAPPKPSKSTVKMAKKAPSFKSKTQYEFEDADISGELVQPSSSRKSGRKSPTRPKKVTLTIRTSFEETSFWQPHMRANGELDFEARLPDSIAEQELIIVASDANGSVGVARKRIRVTQDLHIQANFPKTLQLDEKIQIPVTVTNTSKEPKTVTVAWNSPGIAPKTWKTSLNVPAQSERSIPLDVTATQLGDQEYRLGVSGKTHQDIVARKVRVLPSGIIQAKKQHGAATKKKPFSATWNVSKAARGNDAFVSVAFPTLTAGVLEMSNIQARVSSDPLSLISDMVTAALVLQYAQRHKLDSPALQDIRGRLLGSVGALQFMQRKDGAFSYWRNGQPSAYVTAWALEGMLELQQLDIAVDQKVMRKAANWLAAHLDENKMVRISDISFWEGRSATVQLGLTAEVFDILSRIPKSIRSKQINKTLKGFIITFQMHLKRHDIDPLTAGRAIQALYREKAMPPQLAEYLIGALLQRRNKGHWEPSWFHAYGGQIEATSALIGAMIAIDKKKYRVEIRDAVRYILSTRNAWGHWHNERGTASAIRTLLALVIPPRATGGTLTIEVDGKVYKKVKVDGKDPLVSTFDIQHITLGQNFNAGAHRVRVSYTGELEPDVMLVSRQWKKGAQRKARTATGTTIEVDAPAKVALQAAGSLKIKVARKASARIASLRIGTIGLGEIALEKLIKTFEGTKDIKGFRQTSTELVVDLSPKCKGLTLELPHRFIRRGKGMWPSVELREGEQNVMVSAGNVTVY